MKNNYFYGLLILLLSLISHSSIANTADPQTSPEFCGSCHQRIFKEWKSSRMGQDLDNQKVYQFYAGVNGKGVKDGLGFQPMMHGKKGDCADCHVPMQVLEEHKKGKEVDLGIAMKEKTDHGISCIFCHSVKDVHIDKDADGRYKTRIFDTVTLGDKNTRYGPFDDAKSPVHKTQFSKVHTDSSLCGACHLNQEKFLSISTYVDWQQAFKSGKTDKNCQQCHMPLIEGEETAATGGPKRKGLRKHTFVGAHDKGMLQKALTLKVDDKIIDGKLIINTTVENVGAGHKVPGSGPIRNVILKVDVTDENGNPLKYIGSKKGLLPPLAGFGNPKTKKRDKNDWAGMPGKMYAKVYKSKVIPKMGRAMVGVGGFLANELAFDTALKPKTPDHAKFEFVLPDDSAGKIKVHAKLVYRDAFKPLSDKKKWRLEQRLMTEVTKELKL